MTHRRVPARLREEGGQVSLLIIGFAGLLALAVALVVDASAAYLQRQGLTNLADGAALTAADRAVVGSAGLQRNGGRLVLDAAAARTAVEQYLSDTDARGHYPGLTHEVTLDGDGGVRVRLRAPLDLPLRIPGAPERTLVGTSSRAAVTVVP